MTQQRVPGIYYEVSNLPAGPTEASSWPGAVVIGPTGEELGRVDHVYIDQETGRPTFVAIRVEDAGQPLVPVELVRARGGRLETDLTLSALRRAPEAAPDGVLAPGDEREARRHFGVG